jgi:uncharacterized protein YukE
MSDFNSEATTIQAQIADVQSHYRTINAALQGASRRGSKADVRELKRAKSRISAKLDLLKSKLPNNY